MPRLVEIDALTIETVRFPAGPYRLEGELAYAGSAVPSGGIVLAGPHPLLGGTMNNNVIRAVGDGLAELGIPTLRFDYRGIGQSQGPAIDVDAQMAHFWETSHVPEEVSFGDDLAAALAFFRGTLGEAPVALVGYSFGCSLLPHAGIDDTTALVLIAPTLTTHEYGSYAQRRNPLLVLASEDDFAVDADRLRRWFESLRAPKQLIVRRLDNHFFRGHEDWLVETIRAFLMEQWS
jgi:alpha/beta superfamily hydrolase